MRLNITTTHHGDFTVFLNYSPTADEPILRRFAEVLDSFDSLTDEAAIEKALYDSTKVGHGAGLRLTFSVARREINALV